PPLAGQDLVDGTHRARPLVPKDLEHVELGFTDRRPLFFHVSTSSWRAPTRRSWDDPTTKCQRMSRRNVPGPGVDGPCLHFSFFIASRLDKLFRAALAESSKPVRRSSP